MKNIGIACFFPLMIASTAFSWDSSNLPVKELNIENIHIGMSYAEAVTQLTKDDFEIVSPKTIICEPIKAIRNESHIQLSFNDDSSSCSVREVSCTKPLSENPSIVSTDKIIQLFSSPKGKNSEVLNSEILEITVNSDEQVEYNLSILPYKLTQY